MKVKRIHWEPLYMVTNAHGKIVSTRMTHNKAKDLVKTIFELGETARATLDKKNNKTPEVLSYRELHALYKKYTIASLEKFLKISRNTIYRRLRKAGLELNTKPYKYKDKP